MDTAILDARTGTGETIVINSVTVKMERRVIKLMDHVCSVSWTKKVCFLILFFSFRI